MFLCFFVLPFYLENGDCFGTQFRHSSSVRTSCLVLEEDLSLSI